VARALALGPDLVLLDEPLSTLDAKLREQVRLDLRNIQRRAGQTTIFVTHDQVEALVMSDRMVLMNQVRSSRSASPRRSTPLRRPNLPPGLSAPTILSPVSSSAPIRCRQHLPKALTGRSPPARGPPG
jgi:ABC-type nitrate/sulfonate/bicarbonate transport system ATPase subunit